MAGNDDEVEKGDNAKPTVDGHLLGELIHPAVRLGVRYGDEGLIRRLSWDVVGRIATASTRARGDDRPGAVDQDHAGHATNVRTRHRACDPERRGDRAEYLRRRRPSDVHHWPMRRRQPTCKNIQWSSGGDGGTGTAVG